VTVQSPTVRRFVELLREVGEQDTATGCARVVLSALDVLTEDDLAAEVVAQEATWWAEWLESDGIPAAIDERNRTVRMDAPGDPGDAVIAWMESTFPGYMAGWFNRKIAAVLEWFSAEVAAGNSPRLIIEAPPRHGKSLMVSQRWPVWHMGQNPGHEVICASYGLNLAKEHSVAARRAATSGTVRGIWWGEWGSKLKDQADHWEMPNGSTYKAVGVGGPITGHGAHVLVIDDPFKNSEQARSKTQRDKVWTWYTGDAYTRLAPGGGVLVMHTRWHEGDLVGRLLEEEKKGGDKWVRVRFPAIAEEDEEHRKAGEALHPDRYSLARLEKIRAVLPPWQWAALFQQRPTPASGGLLKREWLSQFWSGTVESLGLEEIVVSGDLTFKGGERSDFVVLQAWGIVGARRYLLDQVRARMDYPSSKAALRAFVSKWNPTAVIIEDKANGPALVADLRDVIPGLIAVNPGTKSKEERVQVGSLPPFSAMQVWLPDPANSPWVHDYIEESVAFPKGKHDDQVDTTSQVLLWLVRRGNGGIDVNELDELARLLG